MTEILNTLAELIQNHIWIAPVLCIVAGVITSFTPCSLSSVPVVIAYISGSAGDNQKKALKLSLTMALGMALTFGAFGTLASVLGHLLHGIGMWWHLLLGAIMILMALQVWGVISLIPEHHCHTANTTRKGYAGALAAGVLSGVFASHCATPVMIALLALAAESGNTLWGIFLLALYAVGHSILTVVAGTSYSRVEKWLNDPAYEKISRRLRIVLGIVIFCIGILMVYFAFLPD
ncbi:MAG: cytochrome c biogenesis CcdA family protein [Ruminococcus sp.]|jgi:cytochrome c-type biogenesis protein